MQLLKHQNAASSVIAVTNTATALFSLMNTAGSVTNSQAYFNDSAYEGPANGIMITPEDGNIRIGYGITPTTALGTLLSSGTKYFIPNISDFTNLKLIRTGSSNVSCSVDMVKTMPGESPSFAVEAVTLEASTLTLGEVSLQETTLAKTTALAASLVVKGSAGTLYGFSGINNSASAQYIQVHNTATLPADTAVPVIVIKVDAGENFYYSPTVGSINFTTGITICNSSTLATKTIGSADCWIQAEYI